jgi:hypothetical protein
MRCIRCTTPFEDKALPLEAALALVFVHDRPGLPASRTMTGNRTLPKTGGYLANVAR